MLADNIKKIYLGGSEVQKMYLGESLIYQKDPADEYLMLGTTTGTSDFMIGSSTSITGRPDCIKVHVVQNPGGINTMYVKQEDVLKTPVCFYGDYSGFNSYEGKKILSIDKWNIDTSNVTRIDFMFKDCRELKKVDLRGFNTSKVTQMKSLFQNCPSLVSVDLSDFNTENVTSIDYMFDGCSSLDSLDVSNFNTINVTSRSNIFGNCNNLTELDLRAFDTTNCSSLYLFDGSYKINKLYLSRNFFNSKTDAYIFNYLYYWTDPESLAMFVEAITAHDGGGKEVCFVEETYNALTRTQKNAIKAKGWRISYFVHS